MFCCVLQCRFCQFEKVPDFKVSQVLSSLLFRRPTSLDRSIACVHTRSNIHAVSVCFRYPQNYDMDYRIFNMPT